MAKEIRARFSRGVIEPLEKVDLEEGVEILITISERARGKGVREALHASAGGWKGLVDAEKLKKDIYADRLINSRPEARL